ncbi:hypothetical protein DPX16_3774 [Anabarilius grahami]|uniref:Uncharacterized protein n=1 Tax=Anabarilius grahami TaxID=495550 RepID=A0A3N0Z902_ANAGA|nr:hypothetical protein DPX16_3774 [Anabarilius grahami]
MRESWKRDGAGDLWRRWSTHTQTRSTRGDRESQETGSSSSRDDQGSSRASQSAGAPLTLQVTETAGSTERCSTVHSYESHKRTSSFGNSVIWEKTFTLLEDRFEASA